MKSRGAGTDTYGMLSADIRRKLLLEFDRFGAHCEPARAYNFCRGLRLFLANGGRMKRNDLLSHLRHLIIDLHALESSESGICARTWQTPVLAGFTRSWIAGRQTAEADYSETENVLF